MPIFIPEILIAQFSNGSLSAEIPAGYSVHPAPRRAARGRGGELFFSALSLETRTPLPAAEVDRVAALMSQVFFETPGSVTAALRAAFVAANAEMLPFSQPPGLSSIQPGTMVQLHAVCAVFRETDLYFGYGGNTLALILQDGGMESYPAMGDSAPRPLGTALNIDLRYGHSVLTAATTVMLAASPSSAWSTSVPAGLINLSLHSIGERMAKQCASQPGPSGAVLVRFAPEAVKVKSTSPFGKLSLFPQKDGGPRVSHPTGRKPTTPFSLKSRTDNNAEAHSTPEKPADRTALDMDAVHLPLIRGHNLSRSPDRSGDAIRQPQSLEEPAAKQQTFARAPEPIEQSDLPVGVVDSSKGMETISEIPGMAKRVQRPATPIRRSAQDTTAESKLTARGAANAFGQSVKITIATAWDSFRSFLAGILPRGVLQENERFTLPPSVLLGTAIAIPLVIIAIVAVMYFRKGYDMEFSRLMQDAQTEASVADAQTDPLQARSAWQKVFDLLQTAAKYGSSAELTILQNHAARMLDDFDGITPLEFKPAIAGGLDEDTQITVLLAGDRELYALDGIHQRILRLMLGQGGYQIDETFLCQAGQYPEITVESLVDMVWIPDLTVGTQTPSSNRSGAIVAIDRQGTVLYCPPGGNAMAGALVTPRTGWSTPSAIDYYNGRLYVLDPENNGFWRFGISDSSGFDQPPSDYFSVVHPTITDTVDFVIASGEIFFLHADGHITRCQYDPLYQPEDLESTGGTLCQSLPYNDTRPGRSQGSRVEDALLNRVYYNEPPEPTLFFLDPLGRGAYRFSLALNFISRYRVTIASDKHEATALAVGADKVLYIAIGNQIYFAQTRTP